jgi:hypothetical protein
LGGLDKSKSPTIFGFFKRDSMSGEGSRRGSIQSLQQQRQESPRHSVGSGSYSYGSPPGAGAAGGSFDEDSPHHVPSTPTLTSRRNSNFGVSIPEDVLEETDKDLIEIESKKSSASDVFFGNDYENDNDRPPLPPSTSASAFVSRARGPAASRVQETSLSTAVTPKPEQSQDDKDKDPGPSQTKL